MQKQGRFDHFHEDTGCKSVGTKLKCALNNTSPNSKNTQPKTQKIAFFNGYISPKGTTFYTFYKSKLLYEALQDMGIIWWPLL